VEFDETQFYADKAPFPIQIVDDSSQVITTLDESASSRILNKIDIPEASQLAQPGLGGSEVDTLDQPTPEDQDQVLRDMPLTPEEPKFDDFGLNSPSPLDPNR
jgi:hypothetical protein